MPATKPATRPKAKRKPRKVGNTFDLAARRREIVKAAGMSAKLDAAAWREATKFKRWAAKRLTTVQGKPLKIEDWEMLVIWALAAGFDEILLLVPKGNGKTTLAAAIGTYHLETTDEAEGYIGAATREQADKMFREAWRFGHSLGLEALPGYKTINRRVADEDLPDDAAARRVPPLGTLRVLASDKTGKGTLEGIAPTLGLVDELHAHINAGLYNAIQGALHKRGGQMLTISTAGADEDATLGRIRRAALALKHVERTGNLTLATDGKFLMIEFACVPDSDLDDLANIKAANPASFVTTSKLRSLKASPSMTDGRWARYHANVWREGEDAWLPTGAWNGLTNDKLRPPEAGQPIVLGLDFARSYDCAALVRLWRPDDDADAPIAASAKIWTPDPQHGEFIPYKVVEDEIRAEAERFDVQVCGYDQHLFKRSAEMLEDEGVRMIVVPMNPTVWVPLTAELLDAIKGGKVQHDGDPEFAKQVNAGELSDTPNGQRLHGRTKRRVDALMAFGIAWQVWNVEPTGSGFEERHAAGASMF